MASKIQSAVLKKILTEIKSELRPSPQSEQKSLADVQAILKKINGGLLDAKATLGGSGAKGTYLGGFDADIFVLFDYQKYSEKSGALADILEKHLHKKFKPLKRLHGSRDYFQIRSGSMTVEIIPILNIKEASNAKNITDVSPLHTAWVLGHNHADEIRLTKQFCKSQNIYGAESYIGGFSGYVCEILTIYYGSFLLLAKNAGQWKEKTVIDPKNYYRGKDVFKEINLSKLNSPLIIIDPVDKTRNAAAALCNEKFRRFVEACTQFLKTPSRDFFSKKSLSGVSLKSQFPHAIIITITGSPKKTGKHDVVGSTLRKAYDYLLECLKKYGFTIRYSAWEWNTEKSALFYFVFENQPLSKIIEVAGPPLSLNEHALQFKKIHADTAIRDGKLIARETRKHTRPQTYLSELCTTEYITSRIARLKIEFVES